MQLIAQLATGDEIIQGDLLNTNSQIIAKTLHEFGFSLGQQLVVEDDQATIATALRYLLTQHDIVITIGGLGPTSDDVTRFAISDVIQQPLVLDPASWEMIQQRITTLGYPVTANNRQQALFPQGAEIFLNLHGTANGCCCQWQNKWIIMLPGPPHECLPLVKNQVLTTLTQHCQRPSIYRQRWLLFRVSESIIADKVTQLLASTPCQVSYRIRYPYLELKLASSSNAILAAACENLKPLITPHLIGDGSQFASEMLRQQTSHYRIYDGATRGHLQVALVTPKTHAKFQFMADMANADITIEGLEAYWSDEALPSYNITIMVHHQEYQLSIPNREELTLPSAIEYICKAILQAEPHVKDPIQHL